MTNKELMMLLLQQPEDAEIWIEFMDWDEEHGGLTSATVDTVEYCSEMNTVIFKSSV